MITPILKLCYLSILGVSFNLFLDATSVLKIAIFESLIELYSCPLHLPPSRALILEKPNCLHTSQAWKACKKTWKHKKKRPRLPLALKNPNQLTAPARNPVMFSSNIEPRSPKKVGRCSKSRYKTKKTAGSAIGRRN